jgi:hypothetical protein
LFSHSHESLSEQYDNYVPMRDNHLVATLYCHFLIMTVSKLDLSETNYKRIERWMVANYGYVTLVCMYSNNFDSKISSFVSTKIAIKNISPSRTMGLPKNVKLISKSGH